VETDVLGFDSFEADELTPQEYEDTAVVSTVAVPIVNQPINQLPLKGRIEAVLFLTNRPLKLDELATLVEAPIFEAEEALIELIQDYGFREDSVLEIDDGTEGYILQLRADYKPLVNKMIPMDISVAAVRTLSVVAIRGPLLQKDLIELRGSSAYDHIQELLKLKLIHKKREGRSYLVSVTSKFHQHFKLKGDKKELDFLVDAEC
jgi:segregation and condensation protein B